MTNPTTRSPQRVKVGTVRRAIYSDAAMVNPGSKRRNEKRLPNMSPDITDPHIIVVPDVPKFKWHQEETVLPLDGKDGRGLQVVQRIERCSVSGQLCDFAVLLDEWVEASQSWNELFKVDTSHGYVHVHDDTSDDRTDIIPNDARADIDKALSWASDYIWEQVDNEISY